MLTLLRRSKPVMSAHNILVSTPSQLCVLTGLPSDEKVTHWLGDSDEMPVKSPPRKKTAKTTKRSTTKTASATKAMPEKKTGEPAHPHTTEEEPKKKKKIGRPRKDLKGLPDHLGELVNGNVMTIHCNI